MVTVRSSAGPVTSPAVPISQVSVNESIARASGVPELDRVLGGGVVPGAAILLAGEPGVGKSTLLLEVAARSAATSQRVLYVTGEESAGQVRLRADRTGGVYDELFLAAETDLGAVLTHIEQVRPSLIVVDSVQTIGAADVDGVPGGVTQVKEVAAALVRVAKTRNIAVVLVGHVTKDGAIAGPARPRAPRRRRAPLRGRPQLALPDAARGQEPLRPGRRGRLLRPRARRHHRGRRPHRALPRAAPRPRLRHLRRGDRWRAAARCSPRCRRW